MLTQRVSLAETGAYTLGTIFTALLMPLLGWGLEHIFIRDVSPNLSLASTYLTRFLSFRILCASIAYLLLFLIVYIVDYSPATQTIVRLMGLMLLSEGINELFQAVLVTFEETRYVLYVVGPLNLLRALLGVLSLWGGAGVIGLASVLVGTSYLKVILLGTIMVRKKLFPERRNGLWQFALPNSTTLFASTFPFVLIDLFWAIEYQSGHILLSIFVGEAAVGLYGAAFALLAIFMLVGQAYMMTIFPVLSRLYQYLPEQFDFVYEKSALYLLCIGLAFSTIVTFHGQALLTLIFSDTFAESATMLVPLIWTLPLFFLHVPISRVMILKNEQMRLALYIGIAAGLNVLITILFVNLFGAVGTSWARLISFTCFFCLNYHYVNRHVYAKNLGRLVLRPIMAILCMGLIFLTGDSIGLLFELGAGIFVYGLLLVILKVITYADLQRFRQILNYEVVDEKSA